MYKIRSFWNRYPDDLDSNFVTANKQFDNLMIKLSENENIFDEFVKIIKGVKIGISEEFKDKSITFDYFMQLF